MGAPYGLGTTSVLLECDTSRETAIGLLRSVAAFAGVAMCDLLDDHEVVQIAPDGTVTTLDDPDAAAIRDVVRTTGGVSSYRSFEHLDGYHVLVPGTTMNGEPPNLPDDYEVHVGPLDDLRAALDRLLERTDIEEPSQLLHRDLRQLCDYAEKFRVPLVLGG
jgi:hypothetical protein